MEWTKSCYYRHFGSSWWIDELRWPRAECIKSCIKILPAVSTRTMLMMMNAYSCLVIARVLFPRIRGRMHRGIVSRGQMSVWLTNSLQISEIKHDSGMLSRRYCHRRGHPGYGNGLSTYDDDRGWQYCSNSNSVKGWTQDNSKERNPVTVVFLHTIIRSWSLSVWTKQT